MSYAATTSSRRKFPTPRLEDVKRKLEEPLFSIKAAQAKLQRPAKSIWFRIAATIWFTIAETVWNTILQLEKDIEGYEKTRDELDRIATSNDENLRPLQGWRRELFGNDALELKAGRLGLTGERGQVRVLRPDELG